MHLLHRAGFLKMMLILSGFWFYVPAIMADSIHIDSVSVQPDNSVIIGWTLETPQTDGYVEVLRQLDNGLYFAINRVPLSQSYYIDAGVNPAIKSYSYYVVAYDINDNVIGNSDNPAHQTAFLAQPDFDACQKQLNVTWDNYSLSTTVGTPQPLPNPFDQLEILSSFNDGPFQGVYTGSSFNDQAVIVATETGEYCMFVRYGQSTNNNTSSSNIVCADVSFPASSQFVYLRSASVAIDNSGAFISIHGDLPSSNPSWVIQRSDTPSQDFIVLDHLTSFADLENYFDTYPFPANNVQYKVIALDSCQAPVVESNVAAPINLVAQSVSPTQNQLFWSEYVGWDWGIDAYTIQLRYNQDESFLDLAHVSGDITSLIHDAAGGIPISGSYTEYRVIASEGSGNPYGFSDQAASNTFVVVKDSFVFLPTAFNPSSSIEDNRVFKPVFQSFTPQSATLKVYNRWGQEIFQAVYPNLVWDGENANPGVYPWVLIFTDETGSTIEKRGVVLMVQ